MNVSDQSIARKMVPTTTDQPQDVQPPRKQESSRLAIVSCDRCSYVYEMAADLYCAGWMNGMRCGLCGPPYALVRVRFTD
jgi:hypothetical protein